MEPGESGRLQRSKTWAILTATGPMLVAYMLLLFSFVVAGDAEQTGSVVLPVTLGLLLVPVAFITLSRLSRQPHPAAAVAKAIAAWVVVMTSLGLMSLALGLSFAFGIGGIFSLRADEGERLRPRFVAQIVALVYIAILLVTAPPIGAFAGGVVPFVTLGLADYYSRNRAGDQAAVS